MMLTQPLQDLQDVYPDHRDAQRLYVLPDRLALALDAGGLPRFTLLRHASDDSVRGGGLLQAFLALERADFDALAQAPQLHGRSLERAPVRWAEARLVLRGVSADQVLAAGRWQPVSTGSAASLSVIHHLGQEDTQILSALVRASGPVGPESVELELRLGVDGLRPGLPWTVTTAATALRDRLLALLPTGQPATAPEVERAFLSLPAGLLSWQALRDGAVPVDAESLTLQTARTALQTLFRRVGSGYEWHPGTPMANGADTLAWRLDLPLPDTVERTLRWSLSHCHQTWSDRPEVFPVVTPFKPLQRVTVHLLNALPLHPLGLAQLDVELRYRGPHGAWVHRTFGFDSQTRLHALSVVAPAFGDGLSLSFRTLAVMRREGSLPLTLSSPAFVPVQGLQLVLGPQQTGVCPVAVEADHSLWEHAPAVQLVVTAASGATQAVVLTPHSPLAWVCLFGEDTHGPATAQASALGADGVGRPWWSGPLPPEGLRLNGWALEPAAPERVRLRLSVRLAAETALVRVELLAGADLPGADTSGILLTLEPGEALGWSYWRRSVLQPLGYAWRLHLVDRDPATGDTRPLRTTGWQRDQTPDLLIDQVP